METLPLALSDEIAAEVNGASEAGRPVTVAYVDEEGLDVEPRVLEIEVALDEVHDRVVDAALAAKLDDRTPLRVE